MAYAKFQEDKEEFNFLPDFKSSGIREAIATPWGKGDDGVTSSTVGAEGKLLSQPGRRKGDDGQARREIWTCNRTIMEKVGQMLSTNWTRGKR